MKLKLKLDKTRVGQYILYWGAQPYSRNDMLSIQNANKHIINLLIMVSLKLVKMVIHVLF